MAVKEGDKVSVEYKGMLEDGTVFDASEKHGKPLEFEVGKKMVIKGFDDALIGMNEGDEKEVVIKPEEGYGQRNDELKKIIPKESLPKDKEVKEGMVIVMQLPNGQKIPAKVEAVKEKEIIIDLNHPLAGKTLKFWIKLVKTGG